MSDYKEYDVDIDLGKGRVTVSEHQSSLPIVIGIIVFGLILAGIVSLFGGNKHDPSVSNPDWQYENIDTSVSHPLTDTKPLSTEWGKGSGNFCDETITDKNGNVYNGYFDLASIDSSAASYSHNGFVEYDARGNWKYLSGVFFPRDWESGDFKVKLVIYADGTTVYDGPWMGLSDGARSFTADIRNCQTVRMEVVNMHNDALPFITPGLEIANVTLHN